MNQLIVLIFGIILFLAGLVKADSEKSANQICIDSICSIVEVFKSKGLTKNPVLVVALHGDAPFVKPSYQYRFAKRIALQGKNVVAVGLLRPGYVDDFNRASDGIRGDTVGDNYDNARVMQVADVIQQLKTIHNAKKVIVAGHSGGSAITAKLIALRPNIVDDAFIVSCPCNINAWRSDMYKKIQYEGFKGNIDISSPVDLVKNIGKDTKVHIFVGKIDDITKPYLSEEYYQALVNAGKIVEKKVIDGHHAIFQNEEVVNATLKVVNSYNN